MATFYMVEGQIRVVTDEGHQQSDWRVVYTLHWSTILVLKVVGLKDQVTTYIEIGSMWMW